MAAKPLTPEEFKLALTMASASPLPGGQAGEARRARLTPDFVMKLHEEAPETVRKQLRLFKAQCDVAFQQKIDQLKEQILATKNEAAKIRDVVVLDATKEDDALPKL